MRLDWARTQDGIFNCFEIQLASKRGRGVYLRIDLKPFRIKADCNIWRAS